MKGDRFRLRALLAAIVADPYRKLIAIVLAFGLWFFIDSRITGSVVRTVSLHAVGSVRSGETDFGHSLAVVLPTDRVVGRRFMDGDREIWDARVRLTGPRFRIDALGETQLDLQVTSFLGIDWSRPPRDIEFTAADIRPDTRLLQDLTIELVDPPRIRLEVERIDVHTLVLSMDYVALDFPDEETERRLRQDTAEFQPADVRILGPASSIAAISRPGPKPLIARIPRVTTERQVSARLELATHEDLELRLAESPIVTFKVVPELETFQFELPFLVDDLALPPEQRGLYRPDAPTRNVRIRAGGQLRSFLRAKENDAHRQEWAAANLRLLVVVPRLEAGASHGQEIVLEAQLWVPDTPQLHVDATERGLDETVAVTLRRQS